MTSPAFTPVDDDLYREIILDHYRHPRRKRAVEPADRVIEANNPLCGDEIDLSLRVEGDRVSDVGFEGRGCSISQASASMLCDAVAGIPVADAAALGRAFRALMQGEEVSRDLGDLEALRGVRAYPVRVKCATLAWNALLEALGDDSGDD